MIRQDVAPDPFDEILREARRRGRVVVIHPESGPVFVSAEFALSPASLEALDRLDRISPRRKS